MSEFLERISKLSPKRLALLALELQTRVDAVEGSAPEPLAVVGLGCRFPGGADSPAAFWQLLRRGDDAITEVPRRPMGRGRLLRPGSGRCRARWRRAAGASSGRRSLRRRSSSASRRARRPAWTRSSACCWRSPGRRWRTPGSRPDGLAGSATGVFVGICNADYCHRIVRGDAAGLDAYVAHRGRAQRRRRGGSRTCSGCRGRAWRSTPRARRRWWRSTSPCQSLRHGECRMALAGGVNLILAPETSIIAVAARA